MDMKINNYSICFYDENGNEVMTIDHSRDECVWLFYSDALINVKRDCELYNFLDKFMQQDYVFADSVLKYYKDKEKLIWPSDCYYDPNDEWSVDSVSCLNIEKKEDSFDIWCSKKTDKKTDRLDKTYCICFSPCGNGSFSKNLKTGSTLQDDFVVFIYNSLFYKNNVKSLRQKKY